MKSKKWRTVTEADVDAFLRDISGIRGACTKHEARALQALQRVLTIAGVGQSHALHAQRTRRRQRRRVVLAARLAPRGQDRCEGHHR